MTQDTSWRVPFQVDASAYSVAGKVREQNEDTECIASALGLFAVADGLGGHQAGERASGMAVEVLVRDVQGAYDQAVSPHLNILLQAFDRANLGILAEASGDSARTGMATTLTAVWIVGRNLLLAHVGDSRAWRVRDGSIEQLTQDHTAVEDQVRAGLLSAGEASCHPMRHILSRCLGIREAKIAAQTMVQQACDRDGKDNITAVVVACREE